MDLARQSTAIRRRTFLIGTTLLLTGGCTPPVSAARLGQVVPPAVPAASHDISDLLASSPFYIAHRGSGDNWPEHTMAAYTAAVDLGAKAIEVSVCATQDGVLVCHHDLSLSRSTGVARLVSELTWDELVHLRVDARRWLGPNTPLEPIPRLTDVLDEFSARSAVFLEDKTGDHTAELLDLMDSYAQPQAHFVWKQWAGASQHRAASRRGYRTWGYLTSDLLERTDELARSFDLLGVSHLASDDEISAVVATGKPVIGWEVHDRCGRDRLAALGVQGMMTSNLPYVADLVEPSSTDDFASGRRAAGDLPWTTDLGWSVQPEFDPLTRSITLGGTGLLAYRMGSMAPVECPAYTLRFEMRWPDQLPGAAQHAGLAFGLADDTDYRPFVVGASSGYHLVLRREGALQLYSRSAGESDGTLLATVATLPPQSGEWIELQVDVTPDRLRVSRQGRAPWTLEADDTSHRGAYFSLVRNYRAPVAVQFRGIQLVRH